MAACYAHSGRDEAARGHAAEVLRLKPDFAVKDMERTDSYPDPVDLEHLKDGLRKVELLG
jgi:hypothetical protein